MQDTRTRILGRVDTSSNRLVEPERNSNDPIGDLGHFLSVKLSDMLLTSSSSFNESLSRSRSPLKVRFSPARLEQPARRIGCDSKSDDVIRTRCQPSSHTDPRDVISTFANVISQRFTVCEKFDFSNSDCSLLPARIPYTPDAARASSRRKFGCSRPPPVALGSTRSNGRCAASRCSRRRLRLDESIYFNDADDSHREPAVSR